MNFLFPDFLVEHPVLKNNYNALSTTKESLFEHFMCDIIKF
jgi:hypothetical protein